MRYKKFIIAAALPMFWACTNDSDNTSPETTLETIEIVAGWEKDALSKTVLSGTTVLWSSGDKIRVNGYESNAAILSNGDATAKFRVSGVAQNADYFCLYPSVLCTSSADYTDGGTYGTYSATLPTTQPYVANGFGNGANPSVGYQPSGYTGTTTFKNLCGIAKMTFTGNLSNIRYVEIFTDPECSGTAQITVNNPAETSTINATGGHNITMDLGSTNIKNLNNGSFTVYFVLPPNAYTSFSVYLYDSDDTRLWFRGANSTINIERGTITDLGEIDFTTRWAGSNIYWDNTNNCLTFAAAEDANVVTKQHYQGVFFKWGSLVGIDPYSTWSVTSTKLYYPTDPTVSTPSWTTGYADTGLNNWGGATYANIPFSTSETLLSSTYTIVDYRGDICRYLSGKANVPAGNWHIPSTYSDYGSGDTKSGSGGTSNEQGTGYVTNGRMSKGAFLPCSGRRNASGGLENFAIVGYYNDATLHSGYYGYYAGGIEYSVISGSAIGTGLYVNYATTVRCIKD